MIYNDTTSTFHPTPPCPTHSDIKVRRPKRWKQKRTIRGQGRDRAQSANGQREWGYGVGWQKVAAKAGEWIWRWKCHFTRLGWEQALGAAEVTATNLSGLSEGLGTRYCRWEEKTCAKRTLEQRPEWSGAGRYLDTDHTRKTSRPMHVEMLQCNQHNSWQKCWHFLRSEFPFLPSLSPTFPLPITCLASESSLCLLQQQQNIRGK